MHPTINVSLELLKQTIALAFEQFRAAIRRDALDLALEVQRISQDLQHQGQGMGRIRHTLFDLVQEKVDHLEEKFRMFGEHLDGITKTVDRNDHAKCSSIGQIINEQKDIRRLVEELASRLDHPGPQESVGETQRESSLAIQLEIRELKAKVLCLTEQYTEHEGKVNFFSGMSEQVALLEQQIHRWRYRLPDLTDDHSRERIVSAVEAQVQGFDDGKGLGGESCSLCS